MLRPPHNWPLASIASGVSAHRLPSFLCYRSSRHRLLYGSSAHHTYSRISSRLDLLCELVPVHANSKSGFTLGRFPLAPTVIWQTLVTFPANFANRPTQRFPFRVAVTPSPSFSLLLVRLLVPQALSDLSPHLLHVPPVLHLDLSGGLPASVHSSPLRIRPHTPLLDTPLVFFSSSASPASWVMTCGDPVGSALICASL